MHRPIFLPRRRSSLGQYLLAAIVSLVAFPVCPPHAVAAPSTDVQWRFELAGGVPTKLVWQTEAGMSYELWESPTLVSWSQVPGYPKVGNGGSMEHVLTTPAKSHFRLRISSTTSQEFLLIPGGSFQMGDAQAAGLPDERPVHVVSINAFHLARHEVTKARWDEVRTWGLAHGYTDLEAGAGKAPTHPVHHVSWQNAVKWCNARSEMESLTPCYYTDSTQTVVYRTGANELSSGQVRWDSGGYRLPTEAEWEKAARAGMEGLHFPWGNTITHAQANYNSDGNYAYDVSPTTGFHPIYFTGSEPYTSPVGSFAANDYGLHDMTGNVWEWCWDRFDKDYYGSSPSTNPRGPEAGSGRVDRGGSWSFSAFNCRLAYRDWHLPTSGYFDVGVRLVRSR